MLFRFIFAVIYSRTTFSTKTIGKKEAQKILEQFKNSNTELPSEIITPPVSKKSFPLSKFKDKYLEYAHPMNFKKYLESITLSFKQFVFSCGDIPFNEIDTRTIDRFITSIFSRTQRGAHHYYRTLKATFSKAVEWNYISLNLFTKVMLFKLSKSFPTFISEDGLLIILTNTPYQYLKDIFTVGFYTGLRLSELINMQWNWIDFFQNHITVKCSDNFITKSKKERIVPMSEKVRSILINRFNITTHQLAKLYSIALKEENFIKKPSVSNLKMLSENLD